MNEMSIFFSDYASMKAKNFDLGFQNFLTEGKFYELGELNFFVSTILNILQDYITVLNTEMTDFIQ
jgi:hypothetical protein